MELDRKSIVRGDFPLERRGYDRAAVDAHLDAVAIAVAELVAARIDANVATTISSKVESIVSAAEEAAGRIEREADERARQQDARVEAATNALLERIDVLRAGVEQLAGGLNETPAAAPSAKSGNGAPNAGAFVVPVEVEADRAEVDGEAGAEVEGEAGAEVDGEAGAEVRVDVEADADAEARIAEPGPMLELVPEPPEASAPAQPSVDSPSAKRASDDAVRSTVIEDARLVALQMLLEGSSRDEVDGYLAKHFELPDRAQLLDDVVAAVGG